MIKIFKDFSFESAHFLPHVPESHKCRNMHGHSYKLRVYICGNTGQKSGWVMDFSEVKKTVLPVIDSLDHKCLNDIAGLENPTCENLAIWLWERLYPELPVLCELQVNETRNSGCIYSGT